MIAISNSQRDDILHYIDLLCEAYADRKDRGTRANNVVRRAKILRRQLIAKAEFPASELRKNIKNRHSLK